MRRYFAIGVVVLVVVAVWRVRVLRWSLLGLLAGVTLAAL